MGVAEDEGTEFHDWDETGGGSGHRPLMTPERWNPLAPQYISVKNPFLKSVGVFDKGEMGNGANYFGESVAAEDVEKSKVSWVPISWIGNRWYAYTHHFETK